MKVLITGGAGFLGQRLARDLLARGALRKTLQNGGTPEPITELILLDTTPAASPVPDDARVRVETGDVADRAVLERLIDTDTAVIFHLAAILSAEAEAEFDLGLHINLDGTRALLEVCRARAHRPRLVFTSSVAVYGGALPEEVQDDTALDPQSSYGVQKAMAELLIGDYSRRGFVDGRVLRLPTVAVRPGRPSGAASSFASGIVREALNGETAVCPVSGSTSIWLLSPRKAVQCLVTASEIEGETLGTRRIVNLPGVSTTVDEMIEELSKFGGSKAVGRVEWVPDEVIERIVSSWPSSWNVTRAKKLGFSGDASFHAIVKVYVEDELPWAEKKRA
ncbi:D-erythronate dehydrogenase [Burkholderia sp. Ax-1719]|uniref:D-erythronate dehydrogenase n=1 Tax=Burkholderia sp. Ax-1719 TaxID=2608334 RepID=UPI0014204F86|nr:D-erythronate dehydrogenase [Burkholderia sp. Ax-1719]NIE65232.1 SDR family oxidoreductase [Burkholderia sp. Ax-1719]